ncbi:Cytochrome c domain-containing protein [Novosphingobium lubricantis]|jgi:mono/diheme cytochrome c family protein
MKTATCILAAAAALSLASVGAAAFAQAAPESESAKASMIGGGAGDADGAFVSPFRFSEPDGAKLYKRVCAGCHMGDAKGAKGAGFYPALAGNPNLESAAYPAYVVLHGMHGMPGFAGMMSDEQIAGVVNYVRTNFGNSYSDPITAEEVKAAR